MKNLTSKEMMDELQSAYDVSYWLKEALLTLNKRDILDALADIELLHIVFTKKLLEIQN